MVCQNSEFWHTIMFYTQMERCCQDLSIPHIQPRGRFQISRDIDMILRTCFYEVCRCLLPLCLGIKHIGQRTHMFGITVGSHAEILSSLLHSDLCGSKHIEAVMNVKFRLTRLQVKQTAVLSNSSPAFSTSSRAFRTFFTPSPQ